MKQDHYNGETPEWLSLLKDVFYVLLDTWSKGAFAMWTAYAAFGMKFFQSACRSRGKGSPRKTALTRARRRRV